MHSTIDSVIHSNEMCSKEKISTLIDDIQHLYYMGKFIGLAPFSLQHSQNICNWKLIIIDIVIILFHIVIQFIVYFMIFQLLVMPSSSLLIVDFGLVFTMTFFSVYRTIVSCGFLLIRNKFRTDIINELIKIDEEVGLSFVLNGLF